MRAAVFEKFQGPITIQNVPDPAPKDQGVVIKVHATGLYQKLYNSNHKLVSGGKDCVPFTYNLILWTQNEYTGNVVLYAGKSKYACSFKGTQLSLQNCLSEGLTNEEKKRAKKNGWIKKELVDYFLSI